MRGMLKDVYAELGEKTGSRILAASKESLTAFRKDAIVFGTQSANGYIISMMSFAPSSSWKSGFRFGAELRALILLVLIIITGVAVTPGASG